MSATRATQPMNPAAVSAANDEFYAKHPEMVVNGKRVPIDANNPAQAAMRREWMDAYERNGGQVEPISGEKVQEAKAGADNKSAPKPVGAATVPCPPKSPAPPAPLLPAAGSGTPPPPAPATVPPKPAPANQTPICELIEVKVNCEHGREPGPEKILMVVPDSTAALGDKINGFIQIKGGCGQHAAWSVGGALTKEGKGTAFDFKAKASEISKWSIFTLQSASPLIYRAEGKACAGGPQMYEIRAYPPGKVGAKIDPAKIIDGILSILKYMPIPEEEIEDELNKWIKQWCQGAIEYEGSWKEEDGSWKVYYEKGWIGSFDPLFGLSYKGPVYPMTLVPGFLAKWIKAGLFYEVALSTNVHCTITAKYWPYDGKDEWDEYNVSGGGNAKGSLSLELKLAGSEIAECAISGDAGLGVEVFSEKSAKAEIKFKFKFDGLTCNATLKALWGLVEIQREFQILKERETPYTWPLDDAA